MYRLLDVGSSVAIIASVAAAPAFAGNYTYTVINPSGVTTIKTTGINDAGQVSGYYTDPTSKKQICFIYQNGTLTTVPPPKPSSVVNTSGIGPTGTVVGYGTKGTVPYEFTPGDSKSELLKGYPKGAKVFPVAINGGGDVIGGLTLSGEYPGFIDVGGTYTLINPPGSHVTGPTWINSSGTVAGYFQVGGSKSKFYGFIYQNGNYSIIKPPKSYDGADILHLEDNGDYAGFFSTSSDASIGFTVIGGQQTTYQFPGAGQTSVIRALSATENFGNYSVSSSFFAYHYLNGEYYTLLTSYPNARVTGVNASGSFTGVAYDKNNNAYGFIATCAAGPGQCTQ